MIGCPPLKDVLVRVANFTLHHFARLPSTDASNGFRMFSRRVIDEIAVESDQGFCYSIELLVKAHRLGWRVGEVPVRWIERQHGASRFRVLKWLPAYLRWYNYAFATTWLRRPPQTVAPKGTRLRSGDRMAGKWPKIRSREVSRVSPWMSIMAREVEFRAGRRAGDLSRGRAGRLRVDRRGHAGRPFPLVHQYRPTLEDFTWELPCGPVDPGERPPTAAAASCWRRPASPRKPSAPSATARPARAGSTTASTRSSSRPASRLPNRSRASRCGCVTPRELARMIRAGEFVSQLHVGSLMLAELNGLIELPRACTAWRRPAAG